MKKTLLIFSLMILVGCGDVTLDTTSRETFEKTFDKMYSGLPENKQGELEKSVVIIPMVDILEGLTKGQMPTQKPEEEAYKSLSKLHGKNADEIIAHGKQVEAKISENPMGKIMVEAAMKAF